MCSSVLCCDHYSSHRIGCGVGKVPSVYANVHKFIDWIRSYTGVGVGSERRCGIRSLYQEYNVYNKGAGNVVLYVSVALVLLHAFLRRTNAQRIRLERYGDRYFISNRVHTRQLALTKPTLANGTALEFNHKYFSSFEVAF